MSRKYKTARKVIAWICFLLGLSISILGCQPAENKETMPEISSQDRFYEVLIYNQKILEDHGMLELDLKPGAMKKVEFPDLKSGMQIEINVSLDPVDQPIKIGLIAPDGSKEYVTITGGQAQGFLIDTPGTHFIYAESEAEVFLTGMYFLYGDGLEAVQIEHRDITSEPIEGLRDGLIGEYLYAELGMDAAVQYVLQQDWKSRGWNGSINLSNDYNVYGYCSEHYALKDQELVFSFKNILNPETTRLMMEARRENGTLILEIDRGPIAYGEESCNEIYARFTHPWGIREIKVYLDDELVKQSSWAAQQ